MSKEKTLEKSPLDELEVPTESEYQETNTEFVEERMRFVSTLPFYGMLLMELEGVVTGLKVPTAAVNYKNLFLCGVASKRAKAVKDDKGQPCETFPFTELSLQGRKTILAHEILHLVFEHLTIPSDFDPNISNLAMDAVINRILMADHNFSLDCLPEGCVKPTNDGRGGTTAVSVGTGDRKKIFNIPEFDKKDWIPIYWDMVEQLEKEAKAGGAKTREEIAEAIKKRAEELGKSNPMHGDCASSGDEDVDADFDHDRVRFRGKVISAAETAKNQGTLPGDIQRYIDSLEDGKVHWTYYLRQLLKTEIVKDDFSHKPQSRRAHIHKAGRRMPPIFPKVESETIGEVYLALDTSGSMSESDIRQGLSEFASLRNTTPFTLHFMSCDASAYTVKTYDRHEEPDWGEMPIHGGGGTDFRPVFNKVQEMREERSAKPALLVYFTDTFGSFPEEAPDYKVIWVCNYPGGKVPWGDFVSTVE